MRDSQSLEFNSCIVVLGMHRSGTSAVAGAMRKLGVDLGSDLMPGRAGENAKGFFEDRALVELNSLALGLSGSSWQSLTGPPDAWFDSVGAGEVRARLEDLLRSKFEASPMWGVKDPRICRLLPLWQPLLEGGRAAYVVVCRHPAEVAASLAARNGFSAEKSAWLWLDYTLRAERRTRAARRSFLDYAELLRDPVQALDRVARELDLKWPGRDGGADRLATFVDPALRHQRLEATEFAGPYATLAIELYAALAPDARPPDPQLWDAINERFAALCRQHDTLLVEQMDQSASEVRSDLRDLDIILRERTEWLSQQAEEVARVADRVSALQRQFRASEEQTARLDRLAREQRARGERQELELRYRVGGLKESFAGAKDELLAEFAAREATAERFELELDDKVGVLRRDLLATRDSLVGSIESLRFELQGVQAEFAEQRRRTEMMWNSKPWRAYLALGQWVRRIFRRRLAAPTAIRPTDVSLGSAAAPREVSDVRPGAAEAVATRRPIELPRTECPTVSVVIPIYNQIDVTWHCLHSIATTPTEIDYEVLVVDDGSTDGSREALATIEELRLICKEENTGFIDSCNRGAEEARGRYVLFLNNDTAVTDRWLEELVETFDHFPAAGLVGAKLVYPDGRLQEAGGIVWRDGSAWNFGRGNHPDVPQYSYAREVDYCSGACLMIPRSLFTELGMFDRLYSPAYYEDTDLAFKVRAAGRKVIYQPCCRIYHHEGVSCGTDLTRGVKQHQVTNGERFFERWRETLATHRPPGESPEFEKERGVKQRCLIIDHRMLTPDQDSGSLRMWGIAEILRQEGWKVTFLPDNLDSVEPYARRLRARGVEVVHAPFVNSVRQHLESHGALYDIVLLSRVKVAASNIDAVRRFCPQAMVLFDTVDLNFVREERRVEQERSHADKIRDIELSVARQSTKTIVVSDSEGEVLRQHAPEIEVALISNIYDVKAPERGFAGRSGALFVGGFEHTPNVDAMLWFEQEVLPLVLAELPDFHLYVVGSKPTPQILELASSNVTVAGFVPNINSYLETVRLSVAPLRFGAGVKGKLTQSLAHGVPCVATRLACEGMGLEHEVDVLIGDSEAEFAHQVVRCHEDEALWDRLSAGGIRNTEENASMAVARRNLLAAIESVSAVSR